MFVNIDLKGEDKLTLPKVPTVDLIVDFKNVGESLSEFTYTPPFAASDVISVTCTSYLATCNEKSDKQLLTVILENPKIKDFQYEPGDTVGVLPENNPNECNYIFKTLNILSIVDKPCQLLNLKKSSNLPANTTIRQLFTKYLDIRCIPKKIFLCFLSTFTNDMKEKRILQLLSSREGGKEYEKIFFEKGLTFIDLFSNLNTCRPSIEMLINMLPRLTPRPYSIASSPLNKNLRIVFSMLPNKLCTEMLKQKAASKGDVEIYLRKPHQFRLINLENVILIGPGSGIAPFLGFLEHCKLQKTLIHILLFCGFRYKEDFLFEHELNELKSCGTLSDYFVSFSRENSLTRYVQDNIQLHWKQVGNVIYERNGKIFVCGDYKTMAGDIQNSLVAVTMQYKGCSEEEAVDEIKHLKSSGRYKEDVWT